MPEQIVETSDGVVMIANGIDPVLRWDGYAAVARIAGVIPPTGTPTLGAFGVGTISGTYLCAVRFVDDAGNFSNLSPFSVSATFTNISTFQYGNLPVATQASVVRRQILRNTDGQAETFYVDIDSTNVTSTTATSTRNDDNLATQEAVPLFDTSDIDIANIYDPPPSHKPFMVWHQNRLHFLGVEPYREGSVAVSLGSTTVTGRGTEWPSSLAGRYFYIDGADKPYLIASINVANQTAELSEVYSGETVVYAAYSIKPPAIEDVTGYFSEPYHPESVPPRNAYTFPQDGDDVVGGMNYGSYLYIVKRRRMYRLTTRNDPVADGRVYLALTRGCVNNRCWVVANEIAYMLDEGGVYSYSSDTQGEPASPQIQDIFRRDSFSDIRINWSASRNFHAVHSPQEEIIRWYVSLGEDLYPRHTITLCYTLKRWSVEQVQIPIPASCLGQSAGIPGASGASREQVYYGTRAAAVLALSYDGLDGVSKIGAVRGKVSASAVQSLTCAGYGLSTSVGATIAIASGRARGQVRVVIEAAGAVVRLDRPWDILPKAGDVFQVGGVPIEYRSRQIRYVRTEAKGGRSAEFGYVPVSETDIPQTISGKIYDDYNRSAVVAGRRMDKGQSKRVSTTKDVEGFELELTGTGFQLQSFDGGQEGSQDGPKMLSIGFDGVAGPERVRLQAILLNGVAD